MTLTLPPSQFQSLQRGESVRRVEKCDPQPDGIRRGTFFVWEESCMGLGAYEKWFTPESPFPPAGTPVIVECEGETVECVWGESECKQLKDDPLDEDACEERWFCPDGPLCNNAQPTRDCGGNIIEPAYMNCSCGGHSYSEIWAAGVARDYGIKTTPDTYLFTATITPVENKQGKAQKEMK